MLHSFHFHNKHLLFYRNISRNISDNFCVRELGFNSVPAELKQVLTRDVYILHYITKGKGSFMGEPFSVGDCYFVTPGELEVIEADRDEPYECAWLMFKGRRAKELASMGGFPEHNSVFKFGKTKECADMIREYLFAESYENDLVEACRMEELFYRIMSIHFEYYAEPPKLGSNKAFEIANFIEKNYSNNIRISDLCSIFYLSKNYICTIFKKEYGVTPVEYLITYRMEKAKQLLEISDERLSIAEVSFSIGIDNPLYFSRCFHKRYGLSPSDYRKKTELKNERDRLEKEKNEKKQKK